MKYTYFILATVLVILSGCADSSTTGNVKEIDYVQNITISDNEEPIYVIFPVTAEVETQSASTQETAGEATFAPETVLKWAGQAAQIADAAGNLADMVTNATNTATSTDTTTTTTTPGIKPIDPVKPVDPTKPVIQVDTDITNITDTRIRWKPVADSGGNLVILTPKGWPKVVAKVVYDNKEDIGRSVGKTNGKRETYRFSQPGVGYSNFSILMLGDKKYLVPDPSINYGR